MLIHSVTSPQMLIEQSTSLPMETRCVAGGYMEMMRTPQGLQMSRLCSTDLSMYLKKEYAPGSMIQGQ